MYSLIDQKRRSQPKRYDTIEKNKKVAACCQSVTIYKQRTVACVVL